MDNRPCDDGIRSKCIETFSATQLSSFVILCFIFFKIIPSTYTSTKGISFAVNFFVLINIFYFVIGSWIVEEKYIYILRELPTPYKQIEFLLRFLALMVIPIFSTLLPKPLLATGSFPVNIAIMLISLSTIYFIWDVIVFLGNKKMTSLIHADFIAFIVSLSWILIGLKKDDLKEDALGSYLTLVAILFVAPSIILVLSESETMKDFLKRLFCRERLR